MKPGGELRQGERLLVGVTCPPGRTWSGSPDITLWQSPTIYHAGALQQTMSRSSWSQSWNDLTQRRPPVRAAYSLLHPTTSVAPHVEPVTGIEVGGRLQAIPLALLICRWFRVLAAQQ